MGTKEHKQMMLSGLLESMGNVRMFRRNTYNIAEYIANECKEVLEESGKNAGEKILIAIMRAGNGFIPIFTTHIPSAQIHFIAAKRDSKTFESEILWHTLKDKALDNTDVILLEPMLATGGTMNKIIDLVNKILVPRSITIVSAFSSKQAEDILSDRAGIITFMGGLELNNKKYILIPDPQNPDSYKTLDFGDEFHGT